MAITLDAHGYFERDGRGFFPVGVNYWPASCGVEMWPAWPADEIRHDLDVIRELGLNCIRFFLRWPDFEPRLGQVDETMFERLEQLMQWVAERGLLAHPSLVTGFMSGGHFWPRGKDQRNLYTDPLMRRHSAAFCRRAAAVMAPYRDSVLALDLGNELGCADAWPAPPAAIRDWCGAVTTAMREVWPDCLIVSGTDSGVVTMDYGWRLGEQPGTDFYSVHTYPVPNWNVVPFDGMTDPFCQAILPFATLMARAFGPVMVQEFSTILMHSRPDCEAYLKAVLPACLANGANGFLWWCLRDIHAEVHPYIKCGMERRLGLVDAEDRPKPAIEYVVEYFRALNADSTPAANLLNDVAIYFPTEYYKRDNPLNPGNDPSTQFRRMLTVYVMLTQLGYRVGLVRGGGPIDPANQTIVIPGTALTTVEAAQLVDWVREGGRLIWTGPSWHGWDTHCDTLIGAQPATIRFSKPVTVGCFGAHWTLRHHPADGRIRVQLTTATALAASDDGDATVLVNTLGRGKVLTVLPVPEDTVTAHTADLETRDAWVHWYAGLMREVLA